MKSLQKKVLLNLIAEGKLKNVLEQLVEYTRSNEEEFHSEIIQISARLNDYNRNKRLHLVDDANLSIELARIRSSLLDIINQLDKEKPLLTTRKITGIINPLVIGLVASICIIIIALVNMNGLNINKSITIATTKENPEVLSTQEINFLDSISREKRAKSFFDSAMQQKGEENLSSRLIYLDSAILATSKHSNFFYERGKTRIRLNDFSQAISDLDTAIQLNSNDAPTYDHRGLAKLKICEQDIENKEFCWKAIRDFESAINIYEGNKGVDQLLAAAYYNRGMSYKEIKDYCKALDSFRLANAHWGNSIYQEQIDNLKNLCSS